MPGLASARSAPDVAQGSCHGDVCTAQLVLTQFDRVFRIKPEPGLSGRDMHYFAVLFIPFLHPLYQERQIYFHKDLFFLFLYILDVCCQLRHG